MTGKVKLLLVVSMGLGMTGCVTQEKYNAIQLERDALKEQLAVSGSEAEKAKAEAEAYRKQLEALSGGYGSGQAVLGSLSAQNADLTRQVEELNRKYQDALARSGTGAKLPAPLNNALEELARANPDLLEFDSARGILRFKADVTFASGDASLTAKGRDVINQFAAILNSQARGFEFIVAGHTDNVKVSNPATIRAGHKDNWYLSAHRAITVAELLISDDISPTRMGVTGYADERPIASNTSDSGKARNRRVEVLILPTNMKMSAADNK